MNKYLMKELFSHLISALMMIIIFTILSGIIYPLIVTGFAQVFFKHRAEGSFITRGDKIIGSSLVGQNFTAEKYFWGRPSATANYPYNTMASGASNLGPLNPDLLNAVKARAEKLKASDPAHQATLPVDLITASASGLDPEISPYAAFYQIPRIAKARHLQPQMLNALVKKYTQGRILDLFGESRVNVLELNLALDEVTDERKAP